VIREAIRKEGMVAIGKVVFTSREHIIALEARDKGLLGITLRYPYEVRNEAEYFDDIPDEKIPKDMLDLASHIVETKAVPVRVLYAGLSVDGDATARRDAGSRRRCHSALSVGQSHSVVVVAGGIVSIAGMISDFLTT
jgi:hypothetical protein